MIRETRDLMGANSPEWAATRRSAVEQILDAGRDQTLSGRRVVNVDGLVAKLNAIDDEAVRGTIRRRRRAAASQPRRRHLEPVANISTPTRCRRRARPNILLQLRAAAVADEQIARDFRDTVIAPFLRGENGAAARMQPDELVPWLYRRASPDDARMVMSRLPAHMRAEVERGTVADIIESAITKGRGDIGSVRRLVTGEAKPADAEGIAELLGAGRTLPDDSRPGGSTRCFPRKAARRCRDLALITAKRQQRDATSSAIGGLAAGAAVSDILSRPMSALQAAAVSRGLAQLVTSPGFRRWVTNTKQGGLGPVGTAQLTAISPQALDVATGALAENSDVQAALDWLKQGASQVDQAGRRVVRPPQGAASWEEHFGGPRSALPVDEEEDEFVQAIKREPPRPRQGASHFGGPR